MKKIKIDGNNILDKESFYDEIDRVLTKDLDWKTGHNLDAFNDILRGGFGIHEYEEEIEIDWVNFEKANQALGKEFLDVVLEILGEHQHITFSRA